MEHNPESELSGKIRSIECQPVLWRKHEVWSAIPDNIRPVKKRSHIYQYAAAVVVFMFAHVYPLDHAPRTVASTSAHNPTMPIAEPLAEKSSTALDSTKTDVDQLTYESTVQQVRTATEQVTVDTPTNKELKDMSPKLSEPMEALTTATAASLEDTIDPPEEIAEVPRIKAIIGVVHRQEREIYTRKRKKKLFHKLDREEPENEAMANHGIVVARLK